MKAICKNTYWSMFMLWVMVFSKMFQLHLQTKKDYSMQTLKTCAHFGLKLVYRLEPLFGSEMN